MNLKKPNDWTEIPHADGSITKLDGYGHVIGWTEHGALGWSALWRSRSGDQRKFADNPLAAADVLRAALAEEA